MSEGLDSYEPEAHEEEPNMYVIDGVAVNSILTDDVKAQFIRILVTENRGGEFDQEYFDGYLQLFEQRIMHGNISLVMVDDQPAAVGGLEFAGSYQGRPIYEMGNLVVLPKYRGQKLSYLLVDFRLEKARKHDSDAFVMTNTRHDFLSQRFVEKYGMRELPLLEKIQIYHPREHYSALSDDEYMNLIQSFASKPSSFKTFLWDAKLAKNPHEGEE